MSLLDTGKDLRRLNDISAVLLKYGFGDLIRRFGLTHTFEQMGKMVRQPVNQDLLTMRPGERLRRALEELGPTYVKLGQIMATRVDLFPPEWTEEFEKLQDNARPVPFSTLRPLIEASLGKPLDQLFRSVNDTPIGVASIGQVHRAVTLANEQVVIKVQKPGIRPQIESDLRILNQLARLAADNSAEMRRYRPVDLVREFERSLTLELDFSAEAKNAERIRKNMRGLKWLVVPKVYWELTTTTVAVQQFVDGIPARQLERIEDAGLSRKLIAKRGAITAWKMVLEDGFFHADPHPGNFLILPENRIAMLDYGMVGKLSAARQEQIVQIMRSVVIRDSNGCAEVLASWSNGALVNREQLAADIEDIINEYYGLSLGELDATALLLDITALIRNHDLVLPSDIALLIKAVITLEGFGRLMDADFDLMAEAEPLLKRMIRTRYSPKRLARNLGLKALDAVDRLYASPTPSSTTKAQPPGIDPRHLELLVARLERSQYRQIQAWFTVSGFIVGAILLAGRVPPVFGGISLLGVLAFLPSTVWALWLMLVARKHLREWE